MDKLMIYIGVVVLALVMIVVRVALNAVFLYAAWNWYAAGQLHMALLEPGQAIAIALVAGVLIPPPVSSKD